MDIIYVLVPLSILLILIAILIFSWAVKGGQFDDLDSPAHKILFDDDDHLIDRKEPPSTTDTAQNVDTESDKKND